MDYKNGALKLLDDSCDSAEDRQFDAAMYKATCSQVMATLALVEAQGEANRQAKVANLIAYGKGFSDGKDLPNKYAAEKFIEDALGLDGGK